MGPIQENKQLFSPVFSYRLDDLIHQSEVQPPNHIKLDVDGLELSILRGADEMLSQPNLRSILVEVDKAEDPSGEILRLLKNKGFHIQSYHPRGRYQESKTVANYILAK